MQADGGGGPAREFGEGLPGLWGTVGDRDIISVSGKGSGGRVLRLAGSGRQSEES